MTSKTSTANRPQTRRPNPHPPARNEPQTRGVKASSSVRSMDEARLDGVQLSAEARSTKTPVSPAPSSQPSPLLTEPEYLGIAAGKGRGELERLIEARQDFRANQEQSISPLLAGLESWGLHGNQPQ